MTYYLNDKITMIIFVLLLMILMTKTCNKNGGCFIFMKTMPQIQIIFLRLFLVFLGLVFSQYKSLNLASMWSTDKSIVNGKKVISPSWLRSSNAQCIPVEQLADKVRMWTRP